MKLRNKKTGEIGELVSNNRTLIYVDNVPKYEYNSLLDIYVEWEDYEEPKEDYIRVIESFIHYVEEADDSFYCDESVKKFIEKLKAWKRLKDKGFKFLWWLSTSSGDQVDFYIPSDDFDKEAELDLDLLFGGKE